MHLVSQNLRWLFAATALLPLLGFVLYFFLRRKPPARDELERRRRVYLNRIGRIASAQVTDVIENASGVSSPHAHLAPLASVEKLLCYVYSVAGVRYETAQDVAGLEERVSFSRIVAGQPASVKYDPANPGNSILVADDWSGLV